MILNNILRLAVFSMLVFASAGIAAAQGPVVASNSTSAELEMTATVQTAVQLNISTGAGGATVGGSNSTGLYSVNFGNVNGLGLGSPSAGVTVVIDATGALYKTPINVTPIYSGFTTEAAVIDVFQDPAGDADMAREDDSSISSSSTVSLAHNVAPSAPSGVAIQRFVGMYANRTEAAGAKSATLIYSITVENP